MARKVAWRIFLTFVCLLLGVMVVALVVSAISGLRVNEKNRFAHAYDKPEKAASLLWPEQQFESHTCGLRALSSLYEAFGLDPEAENLRARLGVDVPAVPSDGSTTGTIHPDLFRVLAADGFGWDLVEPKSLRAPQHLEAAFEAGHPALVLITRPETGNLHWVAADRITPEGRLRVSDSLETEPQEISLQAFLDEQVVSLIVIRPATAADSPDPHLEGIMEMNAVRLRLSEREGASEPAP